MVWPGHLQCSRRDARVRRKHLQERLIFARTVDTLNLTVLRQGLFPRWTNKRHGQ